MRKLFGTERRVIRMVGNVKFVKMVVGPDPREKGGIRQRLVM